MPPPPSRRPRVVEAGDSLAAARPRQRRRRVGGSARSQSRSADGRRSRRAARSRLGGVPAIEPQRLVRSRRRAAPSPAGRACRDDGARRRPRRRCRSRRCGRHTSPPCDRRSAATTPRSCVTSTTLMPSRSRRSQQQLQDLVLDGDVERGGRLVGEQQLGRAGERDGDHHALAHAAGKLVRIARRAGAAAAGMPTMFSSSSARAPARRARPAPVCADEALLDLQRRSAAPG